MHRRHVTHSSRAAFSLVEFVIVILVMTILAGVVVPQVAHRKSAARDARRLADVEMVRQAIERYHLDLGVYPPASSNSGFGGWDVSHDGNFIPDLVEKGYLRSPVNDPIGDASHHYRYYVYDHASYGCQGDGQFYVLGILRFESAQSEAKYPGSFECSARDWGKEFEYVTGGGTTSR